MAGFQRDLRLEITDYLVKFFQDRSIAAAKTWVDYQSLPDGSPREYVVFRALQSVLTETPAIEVVYKRSENAIYSIGTQEEKFIYEILLTSDNAHPEYSNDYNTILGKTMFEQLNDFGNRSFVVPNTDPSTPCVYYSEASSIDYQFRRGKALYSCKIDWYCKVLKPNRQSLKSN